MATEIERKFLVHGTPWLDTPCQAQHYVQGYLSLETDRVIRVRCAIPCDIHGHVSQTHEKACAWISIKGRADSITCQEYEYAIPWKEGKLLLEYAAHTETVEKIRYRIPHAHHVWEVDAFLGDNMGLVVAEVELNSEQEEFVLPAWVGEEVSHDLRYKNVNLCTFPFSAWSSC